MYAIDIKLTHTQWRWKWEKVSRVWMTERKYWTKVFVSLTLAWLPVCNFAFFLLKTNSETPKAR